MRILRTTTCVGLLLLCTSHAFSQVFSSEKPVAMKVATPGKSEKTIQNTTTYQQELRRIEVAQQKTAAMVERKREANRARTANQKTVTRKPVKALTLTDSVPFVPGDTARYTLFKKSAHAKSWSAPGKP